MKTTLALLSWLPVERKNIVMKWNSKIAWRIFIIIVFVSWIPINLWVGRHDSELLHAVISGDVAATKQAVADGANVHMTIRRNYTLLQVAAKHHDHVDVARFLMSQGVSPKGVNDDGDTALSLAQNAGREQMTEFLMMSTSEAKKSSGEGQFSEE